MRKVRLGLIGLGYAGKIHLRNCLVLKSAQLVAVSDTSKKALRYAKEIGVKKTYTDYGAMLKDEKIDAMIIALPTFLHGTCVQKVAEAGKDVLLEKPLARNEEEAKEIIKSVNKNGVKLMVGYPNRFHDSFIELKEKIAEGVVGDVQNVYAVIIGSGPFFHRLRNGSPKPVPEWWFKKELTGGGALIDLGCHLINLLQWYFGSIIDIKSSLGYRFNLEIEDHAICIAKLKSGQSAIITSGWFSQKDILRVELYGTVEHAFASVETPNKGVVAIQRLLGSSKGCSLFRREIEYFVNCIKQDIMPSPSAEEGLRDVETICRAYENRIF